MRIISGKFRGKKILEPIDINTRPLKDLTKESIFNIIEHSKKIEIDLNKSNILDLFSGVGSFGIECLSRGVEKTVFIENYKEVLPILKKNLQNLKLIRNYKIIEKDIFDQDTLSDLNIKFDIIFIDPPYKYKNIEIVFTKIKNEKLLKKNGIIILHRHKKDKNTDLIDFKIIDEKKYGISKIIFFISN